MDTEEFHFEVDDMDSPAANLTPMIDVIFILLVFFLCVSQIKTGKLKIDIPKSTAQNPTEPGKKTTTNPVAVEITASGKIAVDDKFCDDIQSAERAINLLAQKRGKDVIIAVRGDQKADYGNIVQVLALLSNAGLKNLELEFDPKGAK